MPRRVVSVKERFEVRRRAAAWGGEDAAPDAELVGEEQVQGALAMLLEHRGELMRLHRQMYLDVIHDLTGLPPLEREAAHWQLLQEQMGNLKVQLGWE